MSGSGLAAVMLMVLAATIVISCWRQIAIFMLYVIFAVFCFGVYYIVSLIGYIV